MVSAQHDALVDWSYCAGLIYSFEVGTEKGECDDFNAKYGGVENKGGDERRRGRCSGAGDARPKRKVSIGWRK